MNDFIKNVMWFISLIFIIYMLAAYGKAEDEGSEFNLVKSTTKVIHQIMDDAAEGWDEAEADSISTKHSPEIQ